MSGLIRKADQYYYLNDEKLETVKGISKIVNRKSSVIKNVIEYLNIETQYKNYANNPLYLKSDVDKIVDFLNQNKNTKSLFYHNTCMKKYGVDSTNKLDSVKEKIKNSIDKDSLKRKSENYKKTCVERYGVDNISKVQSIKDKKEKTIINHYGVLYFSQSDEGKKKLSNYWKNLSEIEKQKMNEQKMNTRKRNSKSQISDKISYKELGIMFDKLPNTISDVVINLKLQSYYICGSSYILEKDISVLEDYFSKTKMANYSFVEKEICDFIKSLRFEIIENSKKIIPPKELDIYIPSKNLAIELNGYFWHKNKDKNYHLNKTIACEEKGIRLIQFWDYEWEEKKDICKSIICGALGIYDKKYMARKLTFKEISNEEWKSFLNKNHIQGYARAEYRYGLYDNGELIQGVGLTKASHKKGELELNRMATKLNCQVMGGFSKLVNHVSKELNCDEIVSYISRRMFDGKGYFKVGFEISHINPPTYMYVSPKQFNKKRIHPRYTFMKNKIEKYYKEGLLKSYDSNKTEFENMENNGYYRIYDCGTIKVKYIKS